MKRAFWFPILIGILLTPLCYWIAVLSSASGLVVMGFFFPYVMILGLLMPNISGLIPILIFALQLPLYGTAFGAVRLNQRFRSTVIGLAVAHFFAVIIYVALISTRSN